jgi:hypothetical protein
MDVSKQDPWMLGLFVKEKVLEWGIAIPIEVRRAVE